MASIKNTIRPSATENEAQLELINNISNLFHDLESKYSQTRKLLDLLAGFIVKKFGNDLDFPQELSQIIDLDFALSPDESNENSQNFNCEICQEMFTSSQDLQYHSAMTHCWIPLQRIEEQDTNSKQLVSEDEDEFFIPIVKIEVPDNVEIEENFFVGQIPEELETLTTPVSAQAQESKISCCPDNDSSSHNSDPEESKKCTSTEPTSTSSWKYGKRKFPCPYENCGKTYTKSSHLTDHVRRHTGETPYICSWPDCPRKFKRGDELSRHFRTHTGDKPYQCNNCLKGFSRKDHLSSHLKTRDGCSRYLNLNAKS